MLRTPELRASCRIPIGRFDWLLWSSCSGGQQLRQRSPLPVAETAHVSGPAGETAKSSLGVETRWAVEARSAMETRWAVETRSAMETRLAGEAAKTGGVVEATRAGAESGEPKEGIAPAVIRPVVVTLRALGIAAAAGRDTTVIRVILGKGVARRAGRLGRGWSRSAQYGRGRERGGGLRWGCRRHRNDFRMDRDRRDQCEDEGEDADRRKRLVHRGFLEMVAARGRSGA